MTIEKPPDPASARWQLLLSAQTSPRGGDPLLSSDREIEGEVVDVNRYGDMTCHDVRLCGAETPATISMRNTAGRRILTERMTARLGRSPNSPVVPD